MGALEVPMSESIRRYRVTWWQGMYASEDRGIGTHTEVVEAYTAEDAATQVKVAHLKDRDYLISVAPTTDSPTLRGPASSDSDSSTPRPSVSSPTSPAITVIE